jgi:hypothetical protein
MRVCRADDPTQRERQRQLREQPSTDPYYTTNADVQASSGQYSYYPQANYSTSYGQPVYNTSPR